MPSLIHHSHLAVLVLNLIFGLDEHPPVEGIAYKRVLPSQYSNRQIVQKLASTLQAKRFSLTGDQCFRVLVIATHRDCVPEDELQARVAAFDKALSGILLPSSKGELIRFSANQIPFVLNLKDPDRDDLDKLDLICRKINESRVGEVVKTPGSFLVFEQEVMEFASQKVERDIITFNECLVIGSRLKMKPEEVEAALMFFHHQFTLLHFRHVLPDLVFTRPQTPLDCINALVKFSYKVGSGEAKGIMEELVSSLKDGIITEEILSHKQLTQCFIPGVYMPHHAIALLCHTFTLAPLSCEIQSASGDSQLPASEHTFPVKRKKGEYLMMSLRPAIPDEDVPKYLPPPTEIAPLLVRFTKNCVPLSCFSKTISCLLAMYDWKLSRADDGYPQCLAHNVVSLFKPGMPGQIVLVDTGHSFQVHVSPGRGIDWNDMAKICCQVKETIFTALKQVFKHLNLAGIEVSPAFFCPCDRKPPLSHSASPFFFNSKWFLNCSLVQQCLGTVHNNYLMWLEAPNKIEKPSLLQLYELNVVEEVGANYRVLGTFLLSDHTGAVVDSIEHNCFRQTHHIMHKILQKWLAGKGKPATWQTLIKTLRSCKLNTLADKIDEMFILK